MKTHYCQAEKEVITFEGTCNWCDDHEWVGLTDDEIEALAKWADKNAAPWHLEFARAIEAKLKEKNDR